MQIDSNPEDEQRNSNSTRSRKNRIIDLIFIAKLFSRSNWKIHKSIYSSVPQTWVIKPSNKHITRLTKQKSIQFKTIKY